MKILFLGDIIGKIGREAVKKTLPELKNRHRTDLVIANVENIAHGKGITEKTMRELTEAGIDVFTSGNHIWKTKEAVPFLELSESPLIRPANYPPGAPGKGYKIVNIGAKSVIVINLLGRVFFNETVDCPFRKLDEILEECQGINPVAVIVDFHAEATSEKVALGWYADGRVSAVLGTHTHVPTADERILPQGTAYITDVGMVGDKNSVIGIKKENALKTFLTQISQPHELKDTGLCRVDGVLLKIDSSAAQATKIERINLEVEI